VSKKRSTAKREGQSLENRTRNRAVRSQVRALAKNVTMAAAEGNRETAISQLKLAVRTLDKAVTKGVLHRNTASRKISRLYRQVNASAPQSPP